MSEDKKQEQGAEKQQEQAQASEGAKIAPALTPAEVRERSIKKLVKGTIVLAEPILAANVPVTEIHYDFNTISGRDYVAAMDAAVDVKNAFQYSNGQAWELFLKGAQRCNPGLDEHDLRERMKWPDVMAAVRVAMLFFVLSSQQANERTRNG